MLRDDWYNLHRHDSSDDPDRPDFKKKWNNWWYYNKWLVVAGLVAAGLLLDFGHSLWVSRMNEPDLQIAYVGSPLPADTAEQLEQAFSALAPDLNGDGQVIVMLNQYPLYTTPIGGTEPQLSSDPANAMAGQTRLTVDLQSGESQLFLLQFPEEFQARSQMLQPVDAAPGAPLWLPWADCPVLREMDLGTFSDPMSASDFAGDSQTLMRDLFIARRPLPETDDSAAASALDALWASVIAGHAPQN